MDFFRKNSRNSAGRCLEGGDFPQENAPGRNGTLGPLLKLMNFMAASLVHMERVPSPLSEDTLESSIPVKALARDCCYDKRKKRGNFAEIREIPA